jgi:hypothetical protein
MTTLSDHLPGWFKRKFGGDPNATAESTTPGVTTGGGSEHEPVVVWEAANLMEAQVVKSRLESEGIPAFIRGEALGALYGLTNVGLARADVLVPAPLESTALEILFPDEDDAE